MNQHCYCLVLKKEIPSELLLVVYVSQNVTYGPPNNVAFEDVVLKTVHIKKHTISASEVHCVSHYALLAGTPKTPQPQPHKDRNTR